MASPTEQIKERLGIVDVVGSYIDLERTGTNYRARCPFHSERTPSFFISPARNTYYCFGCGARGDIFSFVQQFEGLDFRGALEVLARRAGVEVRQEDPKQRDARERLFSLIEHATQFFQRTLADTEAAQTYLVERGVSEQSMHAWRLGYAPNAWRTLLEHLTGLGYTQEEVLQTGLAREKNGRVYDTFRGRIMFPIADTAGRIVAFSGRHFQETPSQNTDEPPKYVNSPETELFHKSHILYGFDRAKHTIRKHGFAIVVEGQLDIILAHQAGYTNTVALSGTALTNEQLTNVQRLAPNLVIAFDYDEAGIAAAGKSAQRALALGMEAKVAELPEDKDPADIIREDGRDGWRRVIREAKHVVRFYLDVLERDAEGQDMRAFRLQVSRHVLPYVAAIQNKVDQEHFVHEIAGRLGISEEAIREELSHIPAVPEQPADVTGHTEPVSAAEEDTGQHALLRRHMLERRLVGALWWQAQAQTPMYTPEHLRERMAEVVGTEELRELEERLTGEAEELVFEAERAYAESSERAFTEDVEELLRALSSEVLKAAYAETMRELRQAEARGDTERSAELLERCQYLARQFEQQGGA